MKRYIKSFEFNNFLVAVMDQKTGKNLFSRLTPQSSQFGFFTEEEAAHMIGLHTYSVEKDTILEQTNLSDPFTGEAVGGIGDCIICIDDKGRIFSKGVSVRSRIRISDGLFAYGGGKVFIKTNKPIECIIKEEDTKEDW